MKIFASSKPATTSLPKTTVRSLPLKNSALLSTILLTLIPVALFAAFFLPTASSSVRYSYRDVAYYYYPLFEQIQHSWESGELPWWNPLVNLGQPLAGDPTSCVFYPGKIIFFLSSLQVCSYALCFKLYLWFHVFLAFYSAFILSRRIGTSKVGATIAGISYAFSGQVLFQYTNVIYLVGSAWAPLHYAYAIAFFKEHILRRKVAELCKLSVVLAMTILGGEPQIVYITLLTSTVVSLFRKNPEPIDGGGRNERYHERCVATLCFLCGVCTLTGLLAAIQILPSLETVARSTRADDDGPRSIWEIPSAYSVAKASGRKNPALHKEFYQKFLCQDFSQNGRSQSIYRFSVGPWRWLEFLFPNIGGKQFPQSSRWFEAFPEELSVWTPTLYFGAFPCLLALATMRVKRRVAIPSSNRELQDMSIVATWLVLFGLLSALGGFGVGWFFRLLKNVCTGSAPSMIFNNGDPVGGLYWILNLIMPKFVEFRYPAKLLTISAIAFSMLAGIGWDYEKDSLRYKALTKAVVSLFIAGVFFLLLWGQELFSSLQIPTNPLFGPFQPSLSFKFVLRSLIQTATVAIASYATLALRKHATGERKGALFVGLILLIVAGDLYFANRWLIAVAPSRLFESNSSLVSNEFSSESDNKNETTPPTRVYRYPIWFPALFQKESSPQRVTERLVWDVETLYPLYPLIRGTAIIDVRGAVMEKEYAKFINAAFTGVNIDADLAFLDVRYALGPLFWTEQISPSGDESDKLFKNNWRVSFKKLENLPSRVRLFRNSLPVDICSSDNAEIISYSGNEIVLLLSASKRSDLIVSEQYWPNWKLDLIPVSEKTAHELKSAKHNTQLLNELRRLKKHPVHSSQSVKPAFGFLRKASIPQGRYCALMKYRPKMLYTGAGVSVATWTALVLTSIVLKRRRQKQNKSFSNASE